MSALADRDCVPCASGTAPMNEHDAAKYGQELGGTWTIVEGRKLYNRYAFDNFVGALAFINEVGLIAETFQHHPDCLVAWGRAEVTIWTHAIDGLHEADFILAAKIDRIQQG